MLADEIRGILTLLLILLIATGGAWNILKKLFKGMG